MHKLTPAEIEAARRYHREKEERQRAAREAYRQEWLARVRAAIGAIAPRHPQVACVYLYGSLMQPGRFTDRSDIDVAVVCDSIAAETPFWRELEHALRRDVDLRPLVDPITRAVAHHGELVYERENHFSDERHP
jgi:predicted nucleotidyltransferase